VVSVNLLAGWVPVSSIEHGTKGVRIKKRGVGRAKNGTTI